MTRKGAETLTLHLKGFTGRWTIMWVLRVCFWMKLLKQTWHWKGLTLLWISMCLFRLADSVNSREHTSHLWPFIPLDRWTHGKAVRWQLLKTFLTENPRIICKGGLQRPGLEAKRGKVRTAEFSKFGSWLAFFSELLLPGERGVKLFHPCSLLRPQL